MEKSVLKEGLRWNKNDQLPEINEDDTEPCRADAPSKKYDKRHVERKNGSNNSRRVCAQRLLLR